MYIFKYFFEVKLTFEMLTVRGQLYSFSTHEQMFLWKRQRFWAENVSTWGGPSEIYCR